MDQTIKCVDCGNDFVFPERDQEYFQERGFAPPKRCKPCRIKKRQRFERQQFKAQEKFSGKDEDFGEE